MEYNTKMESNNIPNDWKRLKIKDISKVRRGASPRPIQDPKYFSKSGRGWIRISDVTNSYKYLFKTTQYLSDLGVSKSVKVEPGNLIMSICATIGKPIIIKIPSCIHDGFVIFDQVNSDVNIEYFFYFLQSEEYNIKNLKQVGTQGNLNITIVETRDILIPPMSEQKAIAEILSTLDNAIQKSDEAITRTERIKREMMNKLFTQGIGHKNFKETKIGNIPSEWDVKKVSEVFEIITGTTPSTKEEKYWLNGDKIWITPTDLSKLKKNIYIYDSERKITLNALNDTNLTELPINSIILSTRAPVGYVAIIKREASFNQGCKALIGKDKNVNAEFYYYYFLKIRKYLESISGGSTFKELSKDSLTNVEIPLPDIDEQKKISNLLLSIDNKLSLELERKQKFLKIKKSLMNDLLTGKKRMKIN